MRVTKLIREYVETEVEKAYAEKTPTKRHMNICAKTSAIFVKNLLMKSKPL